MELFVCLRSDWVVVGQPVTGYDLMRLGRSAAYEQPQVCLRWGKNLAPAKSREEPFDAVTSTRMPPISFSFASLY